MSKDEAQRGGPSQPSHWRSPEALERAVAGEAVSQDEFAPGAAELALDPVGRRDFLGLMSASVALAGTTLTGCIRKPKEKILPYTNRPEDIIPGKPRRYATAAQLTGSVIGLLVESQDGRPTKIEGNPQHPASLGTTDVFSQAAILDLYAPDRPRKPRIEKTEVSLEELDAKLSERLTPLRERKGAGLAVVVQDVRSPTFHALLGELRAKLPRCRVFAHDAAAPTNTRAGAARVGAAGLRPIYDLERADRVLALDADPLGIEGDTVAHARAFTRRRRVDAADDRPNRLYVVEPAFTVTGMNADNRLRLAGSQIGDFLADLVSALALRFAKFPAGTAPVTAKLLKRGPSPFSAWVRAVSADLVANRSVVIVGERQPPEVHALGHLANFLLQSATHNIVRFVPDGLQLQAEPLPALAAAIGANEVEALAILDGNPAYEAPVDLGFAELLARVPTTIHLCSRENETSALARWVVPQSHFLEAWGDLQATDGALSVQQPLIAPLHDSLSPIELVARIIGEKDGPRDGYSLVRAHWRRLLPDLPATAGQPFEVAWRQTVHDGVLTRWDVSSPKRVPFVTPTAVPQYQWSALATDWGKPRRSSPTPEQLELVFQLDNKVYDGRFAANAWLQELPDPVTKLTWDNALLVGVNTAKQLGVEPERVYELELDGRKLDVVPFVTPGVADNCLVLSLGYGRTHGGAVALGHGFNAYALRTSAAPAFARGAALRRLRGSYRLGTTQEHGSMVEPTLAGRQGRERPVLRETTLAAFRKDPEFARRGQLKFDKELLPDENKNGLWKPPNATDGQQWGMTIDLGSCIGCNACTIACQAENNIPVVGKERILNGREMHWIRLDRYFSGEGDDVAAHTQPMACAHCETAPCESVCPVAATVHSPEGLNEMVYNRCIGTRYCSNNCPYKVRRFNFFNYQRENGAASPLRAMQQNPDVTVRFRGVMEKCTYCVQRINQAKIGAKVDGDGTVADGTIVTACEQACPTQAIVFGDVNDPKSRVSQLKRLDRNYEVLADLNLHPRTTYLAKIRNPNPDLV